ncbi:MAG: peptidase M75 family protein [Micrococcales bacterium]|nr:peptidase M75 family protein [Micrococcales bacterium]
MSRRALPLIAASALLAVVLTGCVPNRPGGAGASALTVDAADTGCTVSSTTVTAGNVVFTFRNTGTDTNEFEILADDKLRVVGEKENITPGQTITYVVQLQPGRYFTACRFRQVGDLVGMASLKVTGERIRASSNGSARESKAVADYVSYVRSQTEQLLPAVTRFADAYRSGDDPAARSLYVTTRAYYERIEPTAEAFGELDPGIDYREVDALAEGRTWRGFHRIEKDLWPPAPGAVNSDGTPADTGWAPSTPTERAGYADGLVADVQKLFDLVHGKSFSPGLGEISNGAIGLLDEVATFKITGEEDWWSGTDLADFAANLEGAKVAVDNVKEIAASRGSREATLVRTIDARFASLKALLARYDDPQTGYLPYGQVTQAQRKELSDSVNALAEPMSRLTSSVLGVPKS